METQEIDFNIEEVETAGITLEDDGIEGGVARNEEALSVLENSQTREEFMNELVEVGAIIFTPRTLVFYPVLQNTIRAG